MGRPVLEAWLAWPRGRMDQGHYPGLSERPDRFTHRWGVPGWPSPNPLHDAQAAKLGIEWGFGSRTGHARANGLQIEDILAELAFEESLMVPRGLHIMPW